MGFELKTLQNEDLDLVYEVAEQAKMSNELQSRYWMQDCLEYSKIVIDHSRKIFMLAHNVDRDEVRQRFILGINRGIVVFFENGHCEYSIEKISPHLIEDMKAIEDFIGEIFLNFGVNLNGNISEHDVSFVIH